MSLEKAREEALSTAASWRDACKRHNIPLTDDEIKQPMWSNVQRSRAAKFAYELNEFHGIIGTAWLRHAAFEADCAFRKKLSAKEANRKAHQAAKVEALQMSNEETVEKLIEHKLASTLPGLIQKAVDEAFTKNKNRSQPPKKQKKNNAQPQNGNRPKKGGKKKRGNRSNNGSSGGGHGQRSNHPPTRTTIPTLPTLLNITRPSPSVV